MDTHVLILNVTDEEESAIKTLFQSKGWKYEKTGVVPLMKEELQKYKLGRPSNSTLRDYHQGFSQPYPEQQSHAFPTMTGVPEYGPYDRFNTCTNPSASQYLNMLPADKDTSVSSVENTQGYSNSSVADLAVSVSNSLTHSHRKDLDHFTLSTVRNKYYSPNNQAASYPDMEAVNDERSDTVTCVQQNSIPQYSSQTYESSKDVDTNEQSIKIGHSSIETHYHQDERVNNETIRDKFSNIAAADHMSSDDKTASNKSNGDEVISKYVDLESVPYSNINTRIDLDHSNFQLADSIKSNVNEVNDIVLQNCVKWLLNDFETICKFLKKVLDFELDRSLILPKLKEILAISKYLQQEKLLQDCSSGKNTEVSQTEEMKYTNRKTFAGSSIKKNIQIDEMDSAFVANSNAEKGIEENETDLLENISKTVSKPNDVTAELYKDKTDENDLKFSRERAKVKAQSIECVNNSKSTKWIKCEILNCHKNMNISSEQKSRHFFIDEEASAKVKSVKSKRLELKCMNSGVKKCSKDKKIGSSNKRKRTTGKNCNSKDEAVKYRWTMNRNLRLHKYHRKCETVPPDLDMDNYSVLEKGFYCPDCQFIFKGKNKLILHKKLKSGYCLPDCIYCDADQEKEVFQCTKCPKCFQTKQMLQKHEDKHTQMLRCFLCSSTFYTAKDLKFHIQTEHAENSQPTYLCDLCGAKFKERKVLNAHRRFVHSDERPEVCSSCNKQFKTKSQLKNHLVTHKQVSELNLSCEICGKMFLRVATLKDHVRRHKKEFSSYCPICNKGFYRKYSLEEHMRVHTGDKPFDCKFCGFKCALSCNLVKHMKVHQKQSAVKIE